MQTKTISEINEIYELELEKVIGNIRKQKARRILLQFPDGIKPYSDVIAGEIESKTRAEVFIWFGSCFGACDIPLDVEKFDVDLIVQFGHSAWKNKF